MRIYSRTQLSDFNFILLMLLLSSDREKEQELSHPLLCLPPIKMRQLLKQQVSKLSRNDLQEVV